MTVAASSRLTSPTLAPTAPAAKPQAGTETHEAQTLRPAADVFEASFVAAKHHKPPKPQPAPEPSPTPDPTPAPGPTPEPTPGNWSDLSDKALIAALHDAFSKHTSVSYSQARQIIFGKLDNHGGTVHDVYTDRDLQTNGPPSSSNMNVEHTWPKSLGVKGTPAESDLFHLFPTDSQANSRRSSFPFGVVQDTTWTGNKSKLGRDASGQIVFEPPDAHKGNVARAIFYIATMYNMHIPPAEEAVLKQWNHLDPVDQAELDRCAQITEIQHNHNPFVDDQTLADRISDF